MPFDQYAVINIKGDEDHFIIASTDSTHMSQPFAHTSDPMTEDELRAELRNRGLRDDQIESHIQLARENPR